MRNLQVMGKTKMIQVRSVPAHLHGALVKRARAAGQTLTEYIQAILEREVARPSADEVFSRIARRTPVSLAHPAASLIREERQERSTP